MPSARAVAAMMELIRSDLAALGIVQEVFFSERSLSEGETDQVKDTIEELRATAILQNVVSRIELTVRCPRDRADPSSAVQP